MSRRAASGTGPKTASLGKLVLAKRAIETIRNCSGPVLLDTVTRSPGRSCFSRKKTAGPWYESTWPARTAGPGSPGRDVSVYQPTVSKRLGTAKEPSRLRPNGSTVAWTPIAGMSIAGGTPTVGAARVGLPERSIETLPETVAAMGAAMTDVAGGKWTGIDETATASVVLVRPHPERPATAISANASRPRRPRRARPPRGRLGPMRTVGT